jgi:methylamine dehydrogenase heavy chain
MRRLVILTGLAWLAWPTLASAETAYPEPLPVEPTPAVEQLPADYPDHWMIVQDFHSPSVLDARAIIVDLTAPSRMYKGMVPVGQWGSILPATTKSEIYVAETFYSRLTRGERTDAITIWDKATLEPKGEIVLPGGKRALFVPQRNAFQLTNDENWALVFNFTPASSVTVVDLEARKVLSTIDLPGCMLIYPTGERGFSSLCADGTMLSIALDGQGQPASNVSTATFNDIDDDPFFMMPARIGDTAWFVSFKGTIRGIDLSGRVARDRGAFSLPAEQSPEGEWRPGGWQVVTADGEGRLYVLMNPDGRDGDEKAGGTEVWVMDPEARKRVARISLEAPAISIEATADGKPLLAASRLGGYLDVYDPATGELIRTEPQIASDPLTLVAVP